ncbi:MAG: hypothetical protein AMK73_06120 [Planctomycetes bacterium SM23_32]|nr:MAG: hypothetical protein AMK73_06120 [Planctomycetes bacterium SM23_32]
MQTQVKAQQDKVTQAAEKKARKLFLGSLLLSGLIIVHIVYLARTGGGILNTIRSFLPVVLLWSLTMTAYAFYVLASIARERAQALAESITDTRTGVFSLSYLRSCLEQEHRRAVELGVPAAVVYVDMVDLDRVNQDFGHAIGDIVLKAVAQLIADRVRTGDVVGRVGGDEFAVIMPEAGLREAEGIVRGIVGAIKGYQLELGKRGQIDFLGCRTGVAVFPAEGNTPDEIIAAARDKMARPAATGKE